MSPIRPLAWAALLVALALPARAACEGPSLLDRLSAEERAALDAAVAATPNGEGLFWTAEKDGARVLLAGTMHLPDPRHDALMARLGPAVDAAGLVLVEATPAEEAAMAQAMVETPERFFITEGPTLPERLPPEDWAALSRAASERGVPPIMAAKFRPWFLMLTLSLPPCAAPALAGGAGGLDAMVIDRAEAAGVPLRALEPWTTVLDVMGEGTGGMGEEEALALALDPATLDDRLATEMMVALREGYFAGRVAEMWELSRLAGGLGGEGSPEAEAAFAAMEEDLLDRRNETWIPAIEAAAADSPRVVAAFGAAHLPGEAGVLALLEDRGWEVERLEPCCGEAWE